MPEADFVGLSRDRILTGQVSYVISSRSTSRVISETVFSFLRQRVYNALPLGLSVLPMSCNLRIFEQHAWSNSVRLSFPPRAVSVGALKVERLEGRAGLFAVPEALIPRLALGAMGVRVEEACDATVSALLWANKRARGRRRRIPEQPGLKSATFALVAVKSDGIRKQTLTGTWSAWNTRVMPVHPPPS